jgi:kynurenine formamidase
MQVVGRLSLSNGDQQVKSDEGSIALPHAVLGVEGVYDLQLLRNTFRQYPIYQEFIEGAFGADESIWKQVSPVNGQYGRAWPKKKLVVLAHSPEDNLVDGIQTADMANTLKTQGVKVELVKLRGDHDEIWQRGHQMSKAIEETLKYLQD